MEHPLRSYPQHGTKSLKSRREVMMKLRSRLSALRIGPSMSRPDRKISFDTTILSDANSSTKDPSGEPRLASGVPSSVSIKTMGEPSTSHADPANLALAYERMRIRQYARLIIVEPEDPDIIVPPQAQQLANTDKNNLPSWRYGYVMSPPKPQLSSLDSEDEDSINEDSEDEDFSYEDANHRCVAPPFRQTFTKHAGASSNARLEALEVQIRILGEHHPDVLFAMKRYQEQEELQSHCVASSTSHHSYALPHYTRARPGHHSWGQGSFALRNTVAA
eukprot:CAMPEP_0198286492 /NCGR_PEP_ID=MMETSP1449-20131203/5569_1 /TAXON_ID=420275 /ORGANISM="Attheya septentrionalis, Strain CCMP2084" /LENGTH=275 /DNA_ID=CAMNT_0043984255 /DNA_START=80 /DNA_END=907 /DNA_ORIENTATION=-